MPDNLVTAVWSLSEGGLGLPLFEEPGDRDIPVVIWGGGGSVGEYPYPVLVYVHPPVVGRILLSG